MFIVGKGTERVRVQAASTNTIKIRGKILFVSPDDNSHDRMIHSLVLLGALKGFLCERSKGLTSPL